jgi:uncharacterized glyoxalase superfamily protein PhnB
VSDVQPMLYMEDLERGIAFYRDQLGFQVFVFGHHPVRGVPLIAGAKLDDALVLLTREELFANDGAAGPGAVHLYFHLGTSVDVLHERVREQPDVAIVQPPTDQHWGDRTLMIRDPWGVLLVFSNPVQGS